MTEMRLSLAVSLLLTSAVPITQNETTISNKINFILTSLLRVHLIKMQVWNRPSNLSIQIQSYKKEALLVSLNLHS